MDILKDLVQNILTYYIILSVVMTLIGDSSYKKYIEMFSGLVMIIIILNPLIKLFDAESTLDLQLQKNQLYEITQAESENIMAAELKQGNAFLDQYEETIKEQVGAVMKNYDYNAKDVTVTIDRSLDSSAFGQIQNIEVYCAKGGQKQEWQEQEAKEASSIEDVDIPDIKIETKEKLEKDTEDKIATKDVMLELANMYGLSVDQIKIQVEEDAGNE